MVNGTKASTPSTHNSEQAMKRKTMKLFATALAIAFAVSFGIGGREFASHMLEKLEKRIDNKKK